MSQPLYFLPNLTRAQLFPNERVDRALLKTRLLHEALADVQSLNECFAGDLSGGGPDHKSGLLLIAQSPETDLPQLTKYDPERQDWQPVGDGSLLWIGLDRDNPVRPEDIRRKKQFNGYQNAFGDGNVWKIPVVRRPDGSTELPCDLVFDDAGRVIEPIKAAYQRFWDNSADVSEWFFREDDIFGGPTFDKKRALELAIEALGINYRYDRHLHNRIRVIDSENMLLLLAYTVDLPKKQDIEAAKKNDVSPPEAAASNTTPGQPDDSATTAPAEPTCTSSQ